LCLREGAGSTAEVVVALARASVESKGEKRLGIWDMEKRENTEGRGVTWAEWFLHESLRQLLDWERVEQPAQTLNARSNTAPAGESLRK
jgi:hypothetical protein